MGDRHWPFGVHQPKPNEKEPREREEVNPIHWRASDLNAKEIGALNYWRSRLDEARHPSYVSIDDILPSDFGLSRREICRERLEHALLRISQRRLRDRIKATQDHLTQAQRTFEENLRVLLKDLDPLPPGSYRVWADQFGNPIRIAETNTDG